VWVCVCVSVFICVAACLLESVREILVGVCVFLYVCLRDSECV